MMGILRLGLDGAASLSKVMLFSSTDVAIVQRQCRRKIIRKLGLAGRTDLPTSE